MMSFNGRSYRRTQSDLKKMCEEGLLTYIPPRSTLNDYMNNKYIKNLVEKLIQFSALFFNENEDTAILDSTWFGQKMYTGGFKEVHDKKHTPLAHVRKLHVAFGPMSAVPVFHSFPVDRPYCAQFHLLFPNHFAPPTIHPRK